MTPGIREGYVAVLGGRVRYRIIGAGDGVPLLTLHGGPGVGHDYLEPLQALASDSPVVFFDQLGCGRSDRPNDVSLWRLERFVEEVAAVRKALNLGRVHLFGHSWGGWLAIEYMTTNPAGVVSLTLASTSASVGQFAREAARLKATLPSEIVDTLNRCEAAGDVDSPVYRESMVAFYTRFVCRLDPWPASLLRALENFQASPVPIATIGPSIFKITGNLRDWDRTDRLDEIGVPTLVTCGRYDEMGPPCARTLYEGIPNAVMRIFEQSAHMAHLEETEFFLKALREFLRSSEAIHERAWRGDQ